MPQERSVEPMSGDPKSPAASEARDGEISATDETAFDPARAATVAHTSRSTTAREISATDPTAYDPARAPTLADAGRSVQGEVSATGETAYDPARAATVASTGHDRQGAAPMVRAGQQRGVTTRAEVFRKGDLIGPFVVLDELGRGGMGVVVSAYDAELERKVAIKVLHPALVGAGSSEAATARLRREAQAMAKISHPNVITVHQVGMHEGQVYLVMELIAGGTLRQWLDREPAPSWETVLEAFDSAGRGLAAAHEAGLAHRDFKPDNVLIGAGDGRIIVTDFGLVGGGNESSEGEALPGPLAALSAARSAASLTLTGTVMGTPSFMAPEQHEGRKVGPAADQFSFCVALYQALYLRHPFGGSTYEELRHKVLYEAPLPPPKKSPVPTRLWPVIARGLSRQETARYPSVTELLDALYPERVPSRWQRWRIPLALFGTLAVTGVGYSLWPSELGGKASCERSAKTIERFWGPTQRRALIAATAPQQGKAPATSRPGAPPSHPPAAEASPPTSATRLVAELDRYAQRWAQARGESCEATFVRGEQSGAMLDRRMACLDRRLAEFQGLLARLLAPKGGIGAAAGLTLSSQLGEIDSCSDLKALGQKMPLPHDPKARQQIKALQRLLGRIETSRELGEYEAAQQLANQAQTLAKGIAHAPTLAQLHYQLGRLQSRRGEAKGAETALRAAVEAAARGQDYPTEARAWLSLLYVVGHQQSRAKEGLAMLPAAQASLARLAKPGLLGAQLESNLGLVLLRDPAQKASAPAHLLKAVALYRAAKGPKDLQVATTRDSLAKAYSAIAKPALAAEQARLALEIREELLGPHPDVATSLGTLASALADQHKHVQAVALYRRALAIQQATLPAAHPRKTDILNNLALSLSALGEREEAAQHLRRGLEIVELAFGKKHLQSVALRMNLGEVLLAQGQRRPAWAHFAMALAIVEHARGHSHITVAPHVDRLARFLTMIGGHAEAIAYYTRSLAIREQAFGPMHIDVANTLTNRGAAALAGKKLDPAYQDMSRARMIYGRVLGEAHQDVAAGELNMAIVLDEQQKYAEAQTHYSRALKGFEACVGQTSPLLSQPLLGLGDLARRRGALGEAETYYQRRVAVLRTALAGHERGEAKRPLAIQLMGALTSLGELLSQLQRHQGAQKALEEALELSRQDQDKARAAVVRFSLGRALWEGHQRKRGASLVRQAHAVFSAQGERAKGNQESAQRWLQSRGLGPRGVKARRGKP